MSNNNFGDGLFFGGIVGTFVGATLVLSIDSFSGPRIKDTKIFKEEGKPAAMRLYKGLSVDQIMVQDLGLHDCTEKYVPMREHLDSVKDFADKALEEARIKKQVRWYEE